MNDLASATVRRRRERRRPRSRRRRLLAAVVAILLVLAGLLFLFTDAVPLVPPAAPPTAEQVGAARAAVRQFRIGQASASNSVVRLTPVELAAIGALASNGFHPDRLLVEAAGGTVDVVGSHRLPLGRWLNVSVVTGGGGTGFPPVHLTVGSVTLPRWASRHIVAAARQLLVLRGARLPPLDRLVRDVRVRKDLVTATVSLPPGSGLFSQVAGDDSQAEPAAVANAYCRLVRLQAATPSDEFAAHVRRAFAADRAAPPSAGANRASFLALAMLTVDPRVGELAGVAPGLIARCRTGPVTVRLNGRFDLPKHWALSAALGVATGTQFTQAIGEWKELADSISRQSQFAVGDPSGFSFLDLTADRSGFLTADLATKPESAKAVAGALARAGSGDLLPPSLMQVPDGMTNAAFVRAYGNTNDPRFLAAIARIDGELRRSARQRGGPLAALPDS